MRCLEFVIAIGLISFCYGQKYDTSGALTLSFSPTAKASCGGCNIDIHDFEFQWNDQAYTHVAATVVKFVNNATNVTATSTIQGSNFTLPPSAAAGAFIVSDSVITTNIGGTLYTLTYPKPYAGVDGIEKYSQSPITNGNGTVKCVVSKTALTHAFLLREDISNGLELSAFIKQDGNQPCKVGRASPPMVLVRVSSLTATTTNYVNTPEARTSAAKNASPLVPPSPPTVSRTSSSTLISRPTALANPPAQETAVSSSIATKPTSAEPSKELSASQLIAPTSLTPSSQVSTSTPNPLSLVTPGLIFIPSNSGPARPESDTFAFSRIITTSVVSSPGPMSRSPQKSLPHELSSPLGSVPKAFPIAETTVSRGRKGDTVSAKPVSLGLSGPVVGTNTIPLIPVSVPAGSHTALGYPSVFSIAGTTLTQGEPGVIISGTRISLGPSDVIIGSSTLKFRSEPADHIEFIAPNPTGFSVAGTFITPVEIITISGTPVSLGSSNIVVGTQTVPLPSNPPSLVFSVASQSFTAKPTGFLNGGSSLLSNNPVVTGSGIPVSLGASGFVTGTKIIPLRSLSSLPVFTVAGTIFTPNLAGFLVGSATLSPNGAPITISGTPISLGSSDIVIGTRTFGLSAASSVLTIDGQEFTANPSGFSIGDTEIHCGGPPITISGTSILLGSSAIVVGSSTVPFASVTNGLGPAILSGLGFTATTTPTAGAGAGNDPEPFAGVQNRMEAPLILLASCVGFVGLVWV